MVSHELRAPLAAIKASAGSVLEASPVASRAEMLEFFRLINGQADHMRGLVAYLLDAGSIEAGTLTVAPEATSVAALVERARITFLSGGSRHPVLVELPPALPPAMADRGRIVQVLNNLFSNAARHAPPSSTIRVEAARDGVHVAISVSEEEGGIAPEELPQLFRKRAGPGAARGSGWRSRRGSSRRTAAASAPRARGRVSARFTFTLPAAANAPAGRPWLGAPPPAPPRMSRLSAVSSSAARELPRTDRHEFEWGGNVWPQTVVIHNVPVGIEQNAPDTAVPTCT